MYEMKLDAARLEDLDAVTAFVDGILEALDCPPSTQIQIDVAVEELYVNIVHYAYAPGEGPVEIHAEAEPDRIVRITFVDQGMPYDPLARPDPDITLPAAKRQIGGLGVYMVKNSMDDMIYRREGDRNVLTIRKRV